MEFLKAGISFIIIVMWSFFAGCSAPQQNEIPITQSIHEGKKVLEDQEKAPDFTLTSIDGKKITLSTLFGKKIIVVNFWATWCPYCREKIPKLNQLYRNNQDKIIILGISISEPRERVANFVRKNNVTYPILLDPAGQVARQYGVIGIPKNIIIDQQGRIINDNAHLLDIEAVLK